MFANLSNLELNSILSAFADSRFINNFGLSPTSLKIMETFSLSCEGTPETDIIMFFYIIHKERVQIHIQYR